LKYYLALLQGAAAHALAPKHPSSTLRTEREDSGIADSALDDVVMASRSVGKGVVRIPGVASILEHAFAHLKQMLEPVVTAAASREDLRERVERYQHRLDTLVAHIGSPHDDQLSQGALAATTKRGDHRVDSISQLATDLHWELNRLQANVVVESIDGAEAYSLTEADRMLLRAFMKGIHETAALKYDHSAVRTIAAHDHDALSIRHDLGAGDGQVQIRVVARTASVTYTDRHPRIQFFKELLRPHQVAWDTARVHGVLERCVGEYSATNEAELEAFLAHVASRLVFLIDWNRAYKRLSRCVKGSDAISLLKWAAENNIGHRGFLQAGDVQLVQAALERAAAARLRNGARLDDLIGRDAARLFLMAVLRIASAGPGNGRSPRLMDDEIEAELLLYLQRSDRTMLGAAADHATVIAAAAEWISHAAARLKKHESRPEVAAAVSLIRTWRARSDEFSRKTTRLLDHSNDLQHLKQLLTDGDRAVNALEHAAFMLTLVPGEIDPALVALLDSFCGLVATGVQEYVRLLEEARDLTRSPDRSDLERFLVTVDRVVALDDHCDAAERALLERSIRGPADFRELYVLSAIAEDLELAFDALVQSTLIVRDHILGIAHRP
jgi:uncharacterized protein Yka (UPF0111/DUF47 family)